MSEAKDGRLLDAGQIVSVDDNDFEVITVSAQEHDGKLVNFRYELALKSEIDALREQNKNEQAIEAEAMGQPNEPNEPKTLLPK